MISFARFGQSSVLCNVKALFKISFGYTSFIYKKIKETIDDYIDASGNLDFLDLALNVRNISFHQDKFAYSKAYRKGQGFKNFNNIQYWKKVGRKAYMFFREQGKCWYCGIDLLSSSETISIDHQHPKALGGNNNVDTNLVISCLNCNKIKSCKNIEDFRVYLADLTDDKEHPIVFFGETYEYIKFRSDLIKWNAARKNSSSRQFLRAQA